MQNRAITWIIGILLIVGLGYLLFGAEKATQPSPTTPSEPAKAEPKPMAPNPNLQGEIKIGAVLPLTGDGAAYGLPLQKAAQLAVEEINAANGVGGKKLVIVFEDGKCEGGAGNTAAQKVIGVDGVPAIIGGACSGETLGFAPIANEKKVVVISPSATSPDLTTKGGPYVFRFAPSDALAASVAAQYAAGVDLKARRAAVISETTDYAQGLRRTFVNEFKAQGGKIVYDETYNKGATDFRTQAQKIQRSNPDVVYVLPQGPASGVAILKALKEQNVTTKILTAEVLVGRDVVKENAVLVEGMIGFEAAFDETGGKAAAFTNAYKQRYAEELAFPFYMANAYTSVYLLKELMEKGSVTGEQLKGELDKLKGWSGGALTDVTLDENGDIQWKDYAVMEAKGGEVKRVKVFSAS